MHVVLGCVAGEDQVLERRDERRGVTAQLLNHRRISRAHLAHELQAGEKHRVVARAEQCAHAVEEGVHKLGAFADDTDRAERRLLRDKRIGAHHQLLHLRRQVAANLGG
eukprot:scaffold18426_cov101-Isochrysis_galbana.AAC.6